LDVRDNPWAILAGVVRRTVVCNKDRTQCITAFSYLDIEIRLIFQYLLGAAMGTIPQSASECPNLLLSKLPDSDYQAILPHLEFVETPLNLVVFERDKPIRHAYFPLGGEHSVVATMESGAQVEIGTVGYEGFSPVDLILDGEFAIETTACQIPGTALRMPAEVFRQLTAGDTPLRHLCLRYLQAYLSMVSQSTACVALHGVEHRLARWLLQSHDRVRQDEFTLTQEYLAAMLGVHRPSVSNAAHILQRAGIIEYKRGKVHILDRQRLEDASCECYWAIRKHFERMLENVF
jgi:CRP-like cAMP-binding protein